MPRYFAMQRHWRVFGPPTYVAVALYLGLGKPDRTEANAAADPDELARLLVDMPGAARTVAGDDGFLSPFMGSR